MRQRDAANAACSIESTLQARTAATEHERDALRARLDDVAQALGVAYEADGHAPQAAPQTVIHERIRTLQQREAEVVDLRARLEAAQQRLRVPCAGCPGCSTGDCPDARDRLEAAEALLTRCVYSADTGEALTFPLRDDLEDFFAQRPAAEEQGTEGQRT